MVTKWDLLQAELAAAQDKVREVRAVVDYLENTPCTNLEGEPVRCTVCETAFQTEADFAKHFIVDDPQHPNLGNCPRAGEDRTLWVLDK
jgi:hypothetical protein